MMDFCMPFLIQVLREYTTKIDTLSAAAKKSKEEAKEVSVVSDSFAPPPGFAPPGMVGVAPPIVGVPPPGFIAV